MEPFGSGEVGSHSHGHTPPGVQGPLAAQVPRLKASPTAVTTPAYAPVRGGVHGNAPVVGCACGGLVSSGSVVCVGVVGGRGLCRVLSVVLNALAGSPPPVVCCGGVLLSHTLPGAVPSALWGLASGFGMDTGRFPHAMTAARRFNLVPHSHPRWGLVCVGWS